MKNWEELKGLVLRHFRPTTHGSLYEQWLAVGQTTTVEEYRKMFIQHAAHLEGVSKEVLLAAFIKGLEEEVKRELRVLNPRTLEQAVKCKAGPKGGSTTNGPRTYNPKIPTSNLTGNQLTKPSYFSKPLNQSPFISPNPMKTNPQTPFNS